MPVAWMTTVAENGESNPVLTLIDTGSGRIILKTEIAVKLLGKSEEEIKSATPITAPGVGSNLALYPCQRSSLRLRAQVLGGDSMLIPNAAVFATDSLPHPFLALFGQLDGFQQRWLRHHNHGANRFWQLAAPAIATSPTKFL